ncbi:DUF1972 domain-containing protein [Ramlibacter ginsenosidimutans]|uniref:DUF1972 domain-containing protein n=1 Tax=Ramlibacter ginsenosidimutans TaxID=502333 RepID=A0A934TSW3_9BURK|nr:DUF1972 domain-containing protein [Ramlibacter ginsenosidimutans]MBK6006675.1 DUF1972 domain-containing protein [Ramlibacter ginsenosidimutans]
MKNVAILGTVGLPASYGGFETLAENLVRYHQEHDIDGEIVVYCSAKTFPERAPSYLGASLRYVNLDANGASSVPYDILSLISAALRGAEVILLLGVSGAIALPFLRLFSRARIVTNIDGVEWKREKWKGFARWWLRKSEYWAVRYSHEVIADNAGIARHVAECYGRSCEVIAYGGDHAVQATGQAFEGEPLPPRYALALCRIEPENNVATILEAFAENRELPLVFIGNWKNSDYGLALLARFGANSGLRLLDPIYDAGVLRTIRSGAALYVHGHSAGGTNPSLVEMMHFRVPVLAFDCSFNRCTTDVRAIYFTDAASLRAAVAALSPERAEKVAAEMQRIAQERYTWDAIGHAYFKLLGLRGTVSLQPQGA